MEKRQQILLPAVFITAIIFAGLFFHFLQQYIEEQYASNEIYHQQKIEYMNAHSEIQGVRYRARFPEAFPESKEQTKKQETVAKRECSNSESEKRVCPDGTLIPMYDKNESGCVAMLCREGSGASEKIYYSPYVKKDRQVFIEGQYDGGLTPIVGADANTFRLVGVCASVEMSRAYYGKDKNRIYVNAMPMNDIDAQSFKYLGIFQSGEGVPYSTSVSVDKNAVYFDCGKTSDVVDRKSFEVVGNSYFRDSKNVYYLSGIVNGADDRTFESITYERTNKIYGNFALDKDWVYFDGFPMKEIDPATCKEKGLENCLPENWRDLIDTSVQMQRLWEP